MEGGGQEKLVCVSMSLKCLAFSSLLRAQVGTQSQQRGHQSLHGLTVGMARAQACEDRSLWIGSSSLAAMLQLEPSTQGERL
ncbi:hypothetical protein AOLI_G00323010 [Acnodon oligacanthus]